MVWGQEKDNKGNSKREWKGTRELKEQSGSLKYVHIFSTRFCISIVCPLWRVHKFISLLTIVLINYSDFFCIYLITLNLREFIKCLFLSFSWLFIATSLQMLLESSLLTQAIKMNNMRWFSSYYMQSLYFCKEIFGF